MGTSNLSCWKQPEDSQGHGENNGGKVLEQNPTGVSVPRKATELVTNNSYKITFQGVEHSPKQLSYLLSHGARVADPYLKFLVPQ